MAALVVVVVMMMVVEVVIVRTVYGAVIMGSHCDSKRKRKNLFENI